MAGIEPAKALSVDAIRDPFRNGGGKCRLQPRQEKGMPDFGALRERMVARQIAGRGLVDARLLEAFRDVPRELFVAPDFAAEAYEDRPLPIEAGQTVSQPYIVAFMIDSARVRPGQRVLEVGAGSGYAAAILGRIADEVVAIERHPELARIAAERMERL